MEAKCRQEMEEHKQKLDKEYENILQQFSKELEKLQMKHQQELERKVNFNELNYLNINLKSVNLAKH